MIEAPVLRYPTSIDEFATNELRILNDRLAAEQGAVVVVHGPRGVGKARLVDAFVRQVASQPNTAVFAGYTPSAGRRSFHPFAEIAQQAIAWAEQVGATEAVIDPIYRDLAFVLERPTGEDLAAPSLDQKVRFFESFRGMLAGISQRARMVVVVHELERADTDTLELASYLADELFRDPRLDPEDIRPGILLLALRDDAATPPHVRDFLAEIAQRRTVERIRLEGLDLEGLKRYVQSPRLLEKLLLASEGLPQEIDELIDSLPSNVEELFERKLQGLDICARDTLRALAVSGRPVSARILAEVTGHSAKHVAKALNEQRDARVLDRRIHNGELQFTFARRSNLEVAARAMSPEELARLHGGWACTLAKEADTGGVSLLAHHELRSSEPMRGVPLAIQAAEAHAVAGAFDAAVQTLEEARAYATGELLLVILGRLAELAPLRGSPRSALRYVEEWKVSLPEDQRGRAFHREAELYNAAGDYEHALAALEQARRCTPGTALVDRASIETTQSESYYQLGILDKASASGRAGLALVAAIEGDTPARARLELLNLLGKIALAGDDALCAVELFQETLSLADKSGLRHRGRGDTPNAVDEQARALVNLGYAYMMAGSTKEAETNLLSGISRARETHDLTHVAFGYMNLGVVRHQRGELGLAIECYRECRSLFRRLGNRTQLARVLHNLGNLYLLCGDLVRARAYNDEALCVARAIGVERLVAVCTALDGTILGEEGNAAESEARLRQAMVLQRRISPQRPLETMVELADLELRFGDAERADQTLTEVEDMLESKENRLLQARTKLLRGRTMLALGQTGALEIVAEARQSLEGFGRKLLLRDADLALGHCCLAVRQREMARMSFAAALEIQQAVASELPTDLRRTFEAARPQMDVVLALQGLETSRSPEPSPEPHLEALPRVRPPSASGSASLRIDRRADWAARYGTMIGASPKLHRVFHILDRVAPSDSTVLIYGESGTGKELVAEAIHRNSPRSRGPFVKLNCAALVESLLLSELFGHERGSFTGAHQRKIGRFEMAAGGTIFLDEIGDISPKTQVSLLRVLQEREFERVGGGRPIKVEARIIVATNRNLGQMVRDGTFREDLYYRLKGLTVDLPPLRERSDDIVDLAQYFLRQYARESATPVKGLSPNAIVLLLGYAWPGNIRELENIIRSVALFAESPTIDAHDFDEYRDLFRDGPAFRPSAQSEVLPLPVLSSQIQGDIQGEAREPHIHPPENAPVPQVPEPVSSMPPTEAEFLSQIFARGIPLPELKKRLQGEAIARALRLTQGNITRAAVVLGMRRPRLSQIINASDELKSLCQGVLR